MAEPRRVNLALQGGGAHGAFTWGVLDKILEDDRLEIAGISGTSAGALNGSALKCGLARGSRQFARETLDWVWTQVGAISDERITDWFAALSPMAVSHAIEMSPGYQALDLFNRAVSPYLRPDVAEGALARIVEALNFEAICSDRGPQFHVGATNVRTGKIRLFTREEITPAAILASACLPTLFPAVEIDGEHYWDGGYTGNPALFPLFDPQLPRDILIVNINPLERPELPVTARDIQNRINEISFNSSLLRELRAIAFVQRLVRTGAIPEGAMKDVLVHMIADDALMRQLSVATKSVPNPAVLESLRRAGQAAAARFLDQDFDAIGERSTVDLEEMFA
ncbi:patatin-like phospholipase family protein [Jannaschia seohaensis]|uniref:NTE family protein n=1 Tax=Jannaschia seohaensis TaxID=475081 RepID=A0A2Y9AAP0_9RHOB|nr:patatin-like phospholipase family protein [Jannaschia seohaensis]PWJ21244.1 NTE family protein [Jannaschia seohaensis]SSA41654.1 NTE family protein [Jannaschia seohaensis]